MVKVCPSSFLDFHDFGLFRWICWIQEFRHNQRELFKLYWLRYVRVEACFHAFCVDIAEHVGRESDDGLAAVAMLLLPPPDLLARLVAVFVRHMEVTLHGRLAFGEKQRQESTYKNNGVIAWRFRKDNIGALYTIHDCLDFDSNLS